MLTPPVYSQADHGELRLKVTDASGAALEAAVELESTGNNFGRQFRTDSLGGLAIRQLPYGAYRLTVRQQGFTPASQIVEVRSALPALQTIQLRPASVFTQVNVSGTETVLDPESPRSVQQIGAGQIQQRLTSLPGRSVQDLVDSQPGWLYEGNAVLHPRGSEYQTQIVVDGLPLTENRSPGFAPQIEADDLQAVTIYTAGYPAEYGRKMGGVIELNTQEQTDPGTHGEFALSGGSYRSALAYGRLQHVWGGNVAGASASGSMTDHYLNPVVPQNFTNTGTTGDFSAYFQRDLTASDRLSLSVRHGLSRFLIPNELLQQQAGQRQDGGNFETAGTVRYQHVFSANSLLTAEGMVRDDTRDLNSNTSPTPIAAFQNNGFREGYAKVALSLHRGVHEFKAGVESDSTFLREDFRYNITDPDFFDDDTPQSFSFAGRRADLEQSAFVQDEIHLGQWNISAGLRWDHYQLLLNQSAFSPRLSISRYFPAHGLVVHGSFDRVFQTPSFENILLSSSAQIQTLSPQFLRLPVQPSRGNYYEGGLTKSAFNRLRLDANVYRRDVRNFADDDQLLNTGVSYPIAFDRAVIYGLEGKLAAFDLAHFSGFVSYSYMVGNVWLPVTGGLFLGDDAGNAVDQLSGHVPASQDQRNTVQTRLQYRITPRLWVAGGAGYGSGLPFEYEGTEQAAIAQYGPAVVSRLNFDRGRIRPLLTVSSSIGATLYSSETLKLNLQADGENLNNRLNVLDFNGIFSGNAIAPARSGYLRLSASF
ncbi:MAG TPA: TonB-dependent receptor [Acidobacteriaceae bacterium]|nr:TonB-dependent receptor [Acidobacteriaceae bacterium]